LKRIVQIEAGHPIPDEAGVKGTEDIIKMLKKADKETLIICLISGGGSALLVSPYTGITLEDKQSVTDLLLKSGATIDELNTVRKHLSKVKGGRLAQIAYPATIVTLILSDVITDRLDVIASGPTVPDTTTFQDAMNVIERYSLKDKLPVSVKRLLEKGIEGEVKETPKGTEPFFKRIGRLLSEVLKTLFLLRQIWLRLWGLNRKLSHQNSMERQGMLPDTLLLRQ